MVHLSIQRVRYLRAKLLGWNSEPRNRYPWRKTNNHWHAVVAEVMLQRTKAQQVLPVYRDFVRKYPTAKSFLLAPRETRSSAFANLGLTWRTKTLQLLAEHVDSIGIPIARDELLKLPGVGDYVASAFLSFHLNQRLPLIDSNIVRFYGRFFGFSYDNETRRKKWIRELALSLTPMRNPAKFNYALLDFSMSVCGTKPSCSSCVLRRMCHYQTGMKEKEASTAGPS